MGAIPYYHPFEIHEQKRSSLSSLSDCTITILNCELCSADDFSQSAIKHGRMHYRSLKLEILFRRKSRQIMVYTFFILSFNSGRQKNLQRSQRVCLRKRVKDSKNSVSVSVSLPRGETNASTLCDRRQQPYLKLALQFS